MPHIAVYLHQLFIFLPVIEGALAAREVLGDLDYKSGRLLHIDDMGCPRGASATGVSVVMAMPTTGALVATEG